MSVSLIKREKSTTEIMLCRISIVTIVVPVQWESSINCICNVCTCKDAYMVGSPDTLATKSLCWDDNEVQNWKRENTSLLLPRDRLIKSATEEFVRKDPSDSSRSSLLGLQEYRGLLKHYNYNMNLTTKISVSQMHKLNLINKLFQIYTCWSTQYVLNKAVWVTF